jgi:phage shock protein PspC (stress-responsive transcriptional regulator)
MAEVLKLYRVKEGAVLSGVCQGLEVCGRGSAVAYRLLFVFGSIFYLIGIFIYIAMAISIPVANKEQLNHLRENAADDNSNALTTSGLDEVQAKLAKIQEMKESNLITNEEAEKLRAKALGID